MKLAWSRLSAAILLAILVLAISGASSRGKDLQPNKLLILSTADVKGKTGPCG